MPISRTSSLTSRLLAAGFLGLASAIVWFSLRPMGGQPAGGHIDKVEHFLAYTGLALLGFAALGRRAWWLAGSIVAFGAGVEVLQAMMPNGRTGSVLDGLANTAGVAAAWATLSVLARRRIG